MDKHIQDAITHAETFKFVMERQKNILKCKTSEEGAVKVENIGFVMEKQKRA